MNLQTKKGTVLLTINEHGPMIFWTLFEKVSPKTGQTRQQLSKMLASMSAQGLVENHHETRKWQLTEEGEVAIAGQRPDPGDPPPDPGESSPDTGLADGDENAEAMTEFQRQVAKAVDIRMSEADAQPPDHAQCELDAIAQCHIALDQLATHKARARVLCWLGDFFGVA